MKGNLLKNAKIQSLGYEPIEYARYKRKESNIIKQKKLLDKTLEYDDINKLPKYKNILTKIIIHETYNYLNYRNITINYIFNKIFYNKSYKCFYYFMTLFNENNKTIDITIPEDFKKTYTLYERNKKIKSIKENIKKTI